MYCYTLECRDLSTEEYAELKERLDPSFVACRTIAERILEFYDEESDEILMEFLVSVISFAGSGYQTEFFFFLRVVYHFGPEFLSGHNTFLNSL